MARTYNETSDGKKKLDKSFRDLPKFGDVVRKMTNARIRNYGGGACEIVWDLNEKAIADQIFLVRIRDKKGDWAETYINKQELLHYLRAV